MDKMIDKKDELESTAASPSLVKPTRLNLRRLEQIQKLLQYGAVVVFLIFLGLIAFSYFEWQKIEEEIAGQRKTLKEQQDNINENEQTIKAQKDEIRAKTDLVAGLAEASRESYTNNAAQETEKRRIIEMSIPQDLSVGQIPPRVYFQIGREDQRKRAAAVARIFQRAGYVVPGIEIVKEKASGQIELRYCSTDDTVKQDLEDITNVLMKLSLKPTPRLVRCGNVRPRHYQVWFGYDF